VLVAAVLGPEQREDGELEVIRLALEQVDDTAELSVRQTESPMQRDVVDRLFRDRVQAASVSAASDVLSRRGKGRLPRDVVTRA
jgi:hypothetical protein